MSPVTPHPDEPVSPPAPHARKGTDSVTTDEISRLLSSSIEHPEPDPMLEGPGSWDSNRRAAGTGETRTRTSDGLDITVDVATPAPQSQARRRDREDDAETSLGGVLLKSYASAVTLALLWLLYSGRATPGPAPAREAAAPPPKRGVDSAAAPPKRPVEAARETSDGPAAAATTIGRTVVVDDLEITPLVVLFKSVRTTRSLGEQALVRDHDYCLALTLRVRNAATAGVLTPLSAEALRNAGSCWVDASAGPRLAMFAPAPAGGWKIEGQTFPEVAPGETADLVLLSEPVPSRRLAPSMTWRIRLATRGGDEPYSDVEVRFDRGEVHGKGR